MDAPAQSQEAEETRAALRGISDTLAQLVPAVNGLVAAVGGILQREDARALMPPVSPTAPSVATDASTVPMNASQTLGDVNVSGLVQQRIKVFEPNTSTHRPTVRQYRPATAGGSTNQVRFASSDPSASSDASSDEYSTHSEIAGFSIHLPDDLRQERAKRSQQAAASMAFSNIAVDFPDEASSIAAPQDLTLGQSKGRAGGVILSQFVNYAGTKITTLGESGLAEAALQIAETVFHANPEISSKQSPGTTVVVASLSTVNVRQEISANPMYREVMGDSSFTSAAVGGTPQAWQTIGSARFRRILEKTHAQADPATFARGISMMIRSSTHMASQVLVKPIDTLFTRQDMEKVMSQARVFFSYAIALENVLRNHHQEEHARGNLSTRALKEIIETQWTEAHPIKDDPSQRGFSTFENTVSLFLVGSQGFLAKVLRVFSLHFREEPENTRSPKVQPSVSQIGAWFSDYLYTVLYAKIRALSELKTHVSSFKPIAEQMRREKEREDRSQAPQTQQLVYSIDSSDSLLALSELDPYESLLAVQSRPSASSTQSGCFAFNATGSCAEGANCKWGHDAMSQQQLSGTAFLKVLGSQGMQTTSDAMRILETVEQRVKLSTTNLSEAKTEAALRRALNGLENLKKITRSLPPSGVAVAGGASSSRPPTPERGRSIERDSRDVRGGTQRDQRDQRGSRPPSPSVV